MGVVELALHLWVFLLIFVLIIFVEVVAVGSIRRRKGRGGCGLGGAQLDLEGASGLVATASMADSLR